MFKTVKSKISIIYIGLVLLIVLLGLISVYNMMKISSTIDGLINTNYNSIVRINEMRQALRRQQLCVTEYLYRNREQSGVEFEGQASVFRQFHEAEKATIFIPEEVQYITNIGDYFETYVSMFHELRRYNLQDPDEFTQAETYYNTYMIPQQETVEAELQLLYTSNETALFGRQDAASNAAHTATQMLMVVFPVAAIAGLLMATMYTRRFFAPLNEITQNIKLVRQGNLDRKTTISTQDEFGLLADEFNNMTQRLSEFEKSTLGTLRAEKNKADLIVRSISEPVLILDEQAKIVMMNQAFERLFSRRDQESAGKNLLEVLPRKEFGRYVPLPQPGQENLEDQIIVVNQRGEDLFYHITAAVIPGPEGQSSGLVLLLHNITEMKQLERTRSDFIATISHEFKTPLTSIVMGADMIAGEMVGPLTEDQREIVNTIKEDSSRLEMLVGEMLELSRMESSKTIYQFTSCDLKEIIETSVKQFRAAAEHNNIVLTVDCPDDLPRVTADFSKITWVLNNLLSNAFKYTREGDSVRVEACRDGAWLNVSVSDTGIGIPPEFADQVFEKFVQINGYDVEVRGSGLGLAAAREMIQAHGGKIWCDPDVAVGSRFVFTLPLVREV